MLIFMSTSSAEISSKMSNSVEEVTPANGQDTETQLPNKTCEESSSMKSSTEEPATSIKVKNEDANEEYELSGTMKKTIKEGADKKDEGSDHLDSNCSIARAAPRIRIKIDNINKEHSPTMSDSLEKMSTKSSSTQQKPHVENPYAKDAAKSSSTPPKRKPDNMNVKNSSAKKGRQNVQLLVEGYAFHDNIVGIAHRKNTGEEAFNLTLRNMIIDKELEEDGFSAYVTLRDKSTGTSDEALTGTNGYPQYLFLSINNHQFSNTSEAASAVIEQCEKLQAVRVSSEFTLQGDINIFVS